MPSDIASIDINIAIDAGNYGRRTVSDDIVTAIFHSFAWVNSRNEIEEFTRNGNKAILRYLLER